MPGQDKTGPEGKGSLTGRGLGPCGAGRYCGRGFGFRQPIQFTEEQEKKILEAELVELEAEKKEVEKRLKEIE